MFCPYWFSCLIQLSSSEVFKKYFVPGYNLLTPKIMIVVLHEPYLMPCVVFQKYVEGKCDRCKPGYYHLDRNDHGCTQCFWQRRLGSCARYYWGYSADWALVHVSITTFLCTSVLLGVLLLFLFLFWGLLRLWSADWALVHQYYWGFCCCFCFCFGVSSVCDSADWALVHVSITGGFVVVFVSVLGSPPSVTAQTGLLCTSVLLGVLLLFLFLFRGLLRLWQRRLGSCARQYYWGFCCCFCFCFGVSSVCDSADWALVHVSITGGFVVVFVSVLGSPPSVTVQTGLLCTSVLLGVLLLFLFLFWGLLRLWQRRLGSCARQYYWGFCCCFCFCFGVSSVCDSADWALVHVSITGGFVVVFASVLGSPPGWALVHVSVTGGFVIVFAVLGSPPSVTAQTGLLCTSVLLGVLLLFLFLFWGLLRLWQRRLGSCFGVSSVCDSADWALVHVSITGGFVVVFVSVLGSPPSVTAQTGLLCTSVLLGVLLLFLLLFWGLLRLWQRRLGTSVLLGVLLLFLLLFWGLLRLWQCRLGSCARQYYWGFCCCFCFCFGVSSVCDSADWALVHVSVTYWGFCCCFVVVFASVLGSPPSVTAQTGLLCTSVLLGVLLLFLFLFWGLLRLWQRRLGSCARQCYWGFCCCFCFCFGVSSICDSADWALVHVSITGGFVVVFASVLGSPLSVTAQTGLLCTSVLLGFCCCFCFCFGVSSVCDADWALVHVSVTGGFVVVLMCTFRASCYSTRMSWAHTPVISWAVCLGQMVSS